jgi:hypothetical protein
MWLNRCKVVLPDESVRRFGLLAVLISLFITASTKGSSLYGRITDSNGEPLPFASVTVTRSTHGTTSNLEGYYSLALAPGTYCITYSMIGYHQRQDTIILTTEDRNRDVILSAESYLLNELHIVAGEDPAYAIIRKAQELRSHYLSEVEKYSCQSYIKSTQRLTKFPRKFMGKKLDIGDMVDTTSGIFYLSESVSKIDFLRPSKIREEMISSKVSGNPRTYSFNSAADFLGISIYDKLLDFSGLVPRGIISPLSGSSFLYYRFILEGTFTENGQLVNKIKVIPKRSSDPVFSGDIYIVEDTWRVHSFDLLLTKAQQLQFVDTFRIRQTFIPVENEIGMPFNTTFYFHFNLFGFEGAGEILSVFNEYDLHPVCTAKDFTGEQLKVDASANRRDSSYWAMTRPVPLTDDEHTDYHRRDSSLLVKSSPVYLDSLDRVNNKFKTGDLLTGYSHQNSVKRRSWSIGSPLQLIQFNTVEGFNATVLSRYSSLPADTDAREWYFEARLRYGFSNTHFCPSFLYSRRYNTHTLSRMEISGGTSVNQFNGNDPISPTVNSAYSLWAKKNYMKLYQQDYLNLSHKSEVFNGVSLGMNLLFASRSPLVNTTDYSFVHVNRRYESNLPVGFGDVPIVFSSHKTLAFTLRTRIRLLQRYITRPEGKYILGSRFPDIRM